VSIGPSARHRACACGAVLAGRDVLAVLPTGAGKSLIFQVVSQLLPGLTLVVSPLLALMKDQLDSLVELGIDARAITSLQSKTDALQTLDDIARGAPKLLYVTPERFDNAEFVRHIQRAGVSLFVVYEAHAIMRRSGIIYTATTRSAQDTAMWLRSWGISAQHYHGRLSKSERERVQAMFMDDQIRVVVATNAFGLGVDKPNVRFVIHRDIPASLEAYYQEAGRAGRDGQPARCVLVYRPGDLGRAGFLAGTGRLTLEDVPRVHASLRDIDGATVRQLADQVGLGRAEMSRMVDLLKAAGVLGVRHGRLVLKVADFDPASISLEREESRRAYERSRLEMMRGYAELRECRRRYILNYFGEDPEWERCEYCDVDVSRAEPDGSPEPPSSPEPFALNDAVMHKTLGRGVVQRVTPDAVTVLFDKSGYKTLDLDLTLEQQLLEKIP
jgi:superfamily II DNA helicase RecQ